MTTHSLHPNLVEDNTQHDANAQRLALAEALNARTVRICFLGRCVNAPPDLVRAHWPISNVDNWRGLLLAVGRTNAQGVRRD